LMMRFIPALFLLWACPAMAVGTLDPAIASDGLLTLIRASANSWSGVLRGYATDIFWTLAIMQFVWKFGLLALKQTDITEIAAELIRWIVIIGFYAALLLYSVDWAQAIINSFRQAGAAAAGTSAQLQPGDLFALAVELGRTVASVGLTDPVTAVVVALSATLIVMCFTFIAAFLMVTLIEAYFVINAGVFFMAFGGSEWTREYALAMLRYAVSVGAKLLVLQLIVGIIMTSARTWQAAYTYDETSMLTMLGVSLICAYFCKTLADKVQALISGVSVGGGATLGGMAAAGVAGVAAGAAAMSATMGSGALGGAGKGVSDMIRSSFSGMGGSNGSGGGSASSFMGSGGASSGGGYGSSARSPGPSPRTGGGGYSQTPGTPPSAQPTGQTASSSQSTTSSNNGGEPAASAASPASAAGKIHASAHMATEAAVRSVGIMGSLSVPGMDSASGVSIGPPPSPLDLTGLPGETPENIIRPESASPSMSEELGNSPEAPAMPPEAAVDTMSSIQDALNNRGKPL
jgi:type IV secretion system protein TrbL